eukprot:Nitzschia sp. Nitz4//scaffold299_size22801//19256//19939//NITZ4_008539-RA/size22801-processed-gene-0.53-mRNA-1//-1//CDS//3329546354//4649//frame0
MAFAFFGRPVSKKVESRSSLDSSATSSTSKTNSSERRKKKTSISSLALPAPLSKGPSLATSARFGGPNTESSRVPRNEVLSNLNAAMDLFGAVNGHNIEKFLECTTPDFLIQFEDQEMSRDDFIEELQRVWASFPDFCLEGETFEVRADGLILARNFIPRGTHTGAPFAFGPYEPIPTSGKKVENAPENVCCKCREGKVCRYIVLYEEGDMSGPAGLYTQLGGFPLL